MPSSYHDMTRSGCKVEYIIKSQIYSITIFLRERERGRISLKNYGPFVPVSTIFLIINIFTKFVFHRRDIRQALQKRRNCFSIPFTLCSVNIVFSPKKNDIYYKLSFNENAQVTGLFGKCDIENVFSRLSNIQFFFQKQLKTITFPQSKFDGFLSLLDKS